jgi:lipoprotein signal peptidase
MVNNLIMENIIAIDYINPDSTNITNYTFDCDCYKNEGSAYNFFNASLAIVSMTSILGSIFVVLSIYYFKKL